MLSTDLNNIASALQAYAPSLPITFTAEYTQWLQRMEENLRAIAEQVQALEETPLALQENNVSMFATCLPDIFSYSQEAPCVVQ